MKMKLKPGWTKVRFGDVVEQVKDKVDPATSGLERYVAGEHMDTDDLKIRRWGIIGDGYLGPAFHMRFKPGQVLYGSRRTYLRKVAVADFEGITANTTYVLESKNPDLLLPNFLPYLMQTDTFHEHSIQQSKGSVNPYINFSDLAWFEFALPPIEEQIIILNVIKNSTDYVENLLYASSKLLNIRKAMQNELLIHRPKEKGSKIIELNDIAYINPTDAPLSPEAPFIPMQAVDEWQRDIVRFEVKGNRGGVRAVAGDVIMARITPCLENGKIAQIPAYIDRCGGSTEFIVLRAKNNIDKSYLYWLIASESIRKIAINMMSGTTGRQRVSANDVASLNVPELSYIEQKRIAKEIDKVEYNRSKLGNRLNSAKKFHHLMLNRFLLGA